MFNEHKPRPSQEVGNLPCRYDVRICNRDMQSPIIRLCNYAVKICPSMPGLDVSRSQCLNKIGGRRHEGAAREDPPPPAQQRAVCCRCLPQTSLIPFMQKHFLSNLLSKILGSQGLHAPTAVPPICARTSADFLAYSGSS